MRVILYHDRPLCRSHPFRWGRNAGIVAGGYFFLLAAAAVVFPRTVSAVSHDPVYVSIVHHVEESGSYLTNIAYYRNYRNELKELGDYLKLQGIAMNFQSDWTLLTAVASNEVVGSSWVTNTQGKNIVRYFRDVLGHEVDPHAHESLYNYADVAWLVQQLGVTPSSIAGGYIGMPVSNSVYDHFLGPITGAVFTGFVWQARCLWGEASGRHTEDVVVTGVWRPRDKTNLYENDDQALLPNVGRYENTISGLYELLDRMQAGRIPAGKMVTATLFIGQGEISDFLQEFDSEWATLSALEQEGRIVFAPLGLVTQVWMSAYGGQGYLYRRPESPTLNDYEGDGCSDLALVSDTTGTWYARTLAGSNLFWAAAWGGPGLVPVPGDYTGDGISDLALYDETGGAWYVRTTSGSNVLWAAAWGGAGLSPVHGDYDGDDVADLAVYAPELGQWFIRTVSGTSLVWAAQWGGPTLTPVTGDFDGDGEGDLAVYQEASGQWFARSVAGSNLMWGAAWGGVGLDPVSGDFDGDGIADLAVYQRASGQWFIRTVEGSGIAWALPWGGAEYMPVSGDYDGDGLADLAVYSASTGTWFIRTLAGAVLAWNLPWGAPGLTPVTAASP